MRRLAEGYAVAQIDMVGNAAVVPGAEVSLEKMGDKIDGTWRVESARHEYSRHGYSVQFRSTRVAAKKPPSKAATRAVASAAQEQVDADEARDAAIHGVTNPRWGKPDHGHGDEGEMIVDAKNLDGRTVEFTAWHEEPDGSWTLLSRTRVKAAGKEVRAKIKLTHEDHPDAPEQTKGTRRPASDPLANPRWGKADHAHGDRAVMTVDVKRGLDGARVAFVVEKRGPGGWEPYGTVHTKVEGGQASGDLEMLHPAAGKSTGAPAEPVELRFTAHLEMKSGPRNVRFEANVVP